MKSCNVRLIEGCELVMREGMPKRLVKIFVLFIALVFAFLLPAGAFPVQTKAAEIEKVKVVPEYRQTLARSMLPVLNSWRAGSNWYYNRYNTKLYLSGLKALKYDYTLEQYAMQRAAEIAVSFDHVRPKGDQKSGLFGYAIGENIAATKNVKGSTVDYAMTMFKEEDKDYSGQGHRRMMLSVPADFDAVGVACVYYRGCYYWVQEFGVIANPNTTATEAINGNKPMTVEVKTSDIKSKSVDLTNLNTWQANLAKGETDYLPEIVLNIGMEETWPYVQQYTIAMPDWTSSNYGVTTINASAGTITGVGVGNSTLTMKEPITSTTKTKTVSVTDPNAVTGVTLNTTALALNTGGSGTLSATVEPSSTTNKNVTWSSSNTAVATVSSTGVVKAVKAGTATITAKTVSGGKTAACKVTVSDVIPTGITLNKTSASVPQGGTATITATVTPTNATNKNVVWSSSNGAVATVDGNGVVTGVSPGTTVITAKTSSGSKTATCTVTVSEVVPTGVTINPDSVDLILGAERTLKAEITPSGASNKNVRWSSSDTKVATVSSSGVVKAVGAGNAVITATTASGGKTAACTVNVTSFFTHKGVPVEPTFTGIAKNSDGVSVYVENGSFNSGYTGLAKYTNGSWYYVENGVYKSGFSGMTTSTDGKYYYVKKGKWDKTYTGLAKSKEGKWFYVANGSHNTKYVGIAKSSSGTGLYFVKGGTWDKTYTGLAKYDTDGKWYYVSKGVHVATYSGTAKSTSGNNLFYVKDGLWDKAYTGLAKHSDKKWYYFHGGQHTTNYTGISKSTNAGLYFVNKGFYDTSYTGLAKYTDGKWYYVNKGIYDSGYTGLAASTSDSRLYYVKKGVWDKTFTGYVNDSSGVRRYVKSGIVS